VTCDVQLKVYAWGYGGSGALGLNGTTSVYTCHKHTSQRLHTRHKDCTHVTTPTTPYTRHSPASGVYTPHLVALDTPATIIAAGSSSSFAVCGGRLYGWGAVTCKSKSGGSVTVLAGGEGEGGVRTKPLPLMHGSSVSAIACATDVTAAMVNSNLTSASPDCGPCGGGTLVAVSGVGLFPAKILIRMRGGGGDMVVRGVFNAGVTCDV